MRVFKIGKQPDCNFTDNLTDNLTDTQSTCYTRGLHVYFGAVWLIFVWILASGLPRIAGPSTLDTVYSGLLLFSYAFFYLLPGIFCGWLFRSWRRAQTIAVLSVTACSIAFLFFDSRLFGLYGFHFNSFVWNLISTRGGIAFLGADQFSALTISIYGAALISILGVCLWAKHQLPQYRVRWKWLLSVVLLVSLAERITYSMAYAGLYGPILNQAGTRQALFAMFYGLYGNYWDLFLRDRHPPALFDVMEHYDYQHFLFTSSYFTYPEFDKTIFSSVPKASMVETSDNEAWTRDERNVEKLLGIINQRDKTRPFFGFVFFEATHARYSFPETNTIEQNYLATLDYTDLKADELLPKIDGMRSRYINAAHYVDSQLGRVYDYLQTNDLLKNTIVVVTGDHGEEFMEHGRWGHNSSFVDEQIHVPMVIHHPDYQPDKVSQLTSHMDIPGMLMKSLGVDNPYGDFSLGGNILERTNNDTAIVASWTDLGIVSPRGKLVIPFRSSTQHTHLAMSREDEPMDLSLLSSQLSGQITSTIANSRKFLRQ